MRHDEDRGELAERRQPAQPEDGIETDIAVRKAEIGGVDIGHIWSLALRHRDHKFAQPERCRSPMSRPSTPFLPRHRPDVDAGTSSAKTRFALFPGHDG